MKVSIREVDEEREKRASQYVLIRDLAAFLKRDRETLKANIKRDGIAIVSVRGQSGQSAEAITADDARRVIASAPPVVDIVNPKDL